METLFIIALYWKRPKSPLTVECINKLWCFYVMKCEWEQKIYSYT